MKLRNKKTGEIVLVNNFLVCDVFSEYKTLSDFLEEWEDYKPAEPLIKNEKIRKAVRAWASKNIIEIVKFEYIAGTGSIFKDGIDGVEIGFYSDLKLTNRETYTIAELCGEEE